MFISRTTQSRASAALMTFAAACSGRNLRPATGVSGTVAHVIILLNGTSSAGKTTLAKALQDTLPTPYLLVGIDTVVFALPNRYVNDAAYWSEVYQYHYDGDRIAGISIQPYGDQLVLGLHRD